MLTYKEELEQDRRVPEHEEAYENFFICHTTPKRGLKLAFNNSAIEAARRKHAGFQALLSTKFKDPMEAMKVYREKDVVEKCFDDLKNKLNMSRLRVHNACRMQSKTYYKPSTVAESFWPDRKTFDHIPEFGCHVLIFLNLAWELFRLDFKDELVLSMDCILK